MNYWLMTDTNVTLGKYNTEADGIAGYEKYQENCILNYGKKMPCKLFYNFSRPMVFIREYRANGQEFSCRFENGEMYAVELVTFKNK